MWRLLVLFKRAVLFSKSTEIIKRGIQGLSFRGRRTRQRRSWFKRSWFPEQKKFATNSLFSRSVLIICGFRVISENWSSTRNVDKYIIGYMQRKRARTNENHRTRDSVIVVIGTVRVISLDQLFVMAGSAGHRLLGLGIFPRARAS